MSLIWGFILLCLLKDNLTVNGDPNCPNIDGGFFPNEKNCSQFYRCVSGIAYLFNCSVGLHFNPSINVCDFPQNAKCSVSIPTDATTKPSTPLPVTSTTPKPSTGSSSDDPNCPDVDDGTFLPNKKNCSQFYRCSGGIAYSFNCSAGLHFNPSLNVCDFPQNAKCSASIPTDTTTKPSSTSLPSTSTTPKPSTGSSSDDPNCPDVDDGTFLPNKKNCSQFYRCSGGIAYLFNCSAGLHFNPSLNICDFPQNAKCSASIPTDTTTKPSSTSVPVTSTTSKPSTGSSSDDPNCLDTDGGNFLPNKKNCSQFYQCSGGVAYLFNCSAGLHFNPSLNICDFPQNAGCNASISTETTTNSSPTSSLVTSTTPKSTTGFTSEGPVTSTTPKPTTRSSTSTPTNSTTNTPSTPSPVTSTTPKPTTESTTEYPFTSATPEPSTGSSASSVTDTTSNSPSTPSPVTSTTPKSTTESTSEGPVTSVTPGPSTASSASTTTDTTTNSSSIPSQVTSTTPKPTTESTSEVPVDNCVRKTKKFLISNDRANFFQAFINCKNAGMELAAIENEEESRDLDAYLDPYKLEGWGNGIWLSGTHLNNVDSKQYYWLSTGKRAIFTNWVAQEPDNSLGIQHTMMWVMYQGVTGWSDESQEKILRYVCQYEFTS